MTENSGGRPVRAFFLKALGLERNLGTANDDGLTDLVSAVGRGSVGSVGVKVGNLALGAATTIILARVLGPESYGVYAWAYALVTVLAIPARLGLSQLLVREISAYQLKEKWSLLRGLLTRANQIVLVSSALLAGVAVAAMFVFADRLSSVEAVTLGWGLALLPLMALGELRGAALRGLRRVVLGQLPDLVLRPGFLVLFVGAAALMVELSSGTAMALHSAAAGLAFVIGAALLLHFLPDDVKSVEPEFETREWISSAVPLGLVSGMHVINSRADIVLLGFMGPSEEVGFYQVAVKAAMLVTFALSALNMVIAPYISRLYSDEEFEQLQKLLTASARGVLWAALPVATVLIVFGDWILEFVFGVEYVAGHVPLIVLCVGKLINVGGGSVATLMNMTGNERDTAVGMTAAAGLNIVLNIVLIPYWGMTGAAVATVVTFLAWNVFLCYRAYEELGVFTTPIYRG